MSALEIVLVCIAGAGLIIYATIEIYLALNPDKRDALKEKKLAKKKEKLEKKQAKKDEKITETDIEDEYE